MLTVQEGGRLVDVNEVRRHENAGEDMCPACTFESRSLSQGYEGRMNLDPLYLRQRRPQKERMREAHERTTAKQQQQQQQQAGAHFHPVLQQTNLEMEPGTR